ncbi:hypothetical protein [uncultured Shewanella sp.]|uniref:hypothetical protein n=1 Tax=uncultured Shewanella sp. TaxID=173975 RepID=UPI0026213E9F|nr:hypothetical protein [uncultured Shewanella sp.]
MKFGHVTYLSCNHCNKALSHHPMISVDGRHADLWSDGYFDSPMVPEPILVASCGHCQSTVWIPELIACDNPIDAKEYSALTEPQMLAWLIENGATPSEHQLYIRQKLWQRSNHAYRLNEKCIQWSDVEASNLTRLLEQLDMAATSEALMAVEIYRQLGNFTRAQQQLELISSALPLDLITQVIERIEAKDRRVFRLEMTTSY